MIRRRGGPSKPNRPKPGVVDRHTYRIDRDAAQFERDWGFLAEEAELLDALATGAHSASLREYFGRQAYDELVAMARRGRSRGPARGVDAPIARCEAPDRRRGRVGGPRVLIVPGMMGSRLGAPSPARALLWIDPLQIAAGRMQELALSKRASSGRPLAPRGAVLFGYAKLLLELRRQNFDADFFSYDWRLGIDELGETLARRIVNERRPVSLVAHSMGGLLARIAMARLPDRQVAKLVMLGTPNYGAFAAVQALRGTYPFVRRLASLDPHHSADALAERVFGTFVGLYHLLPPRRGGEPLDLLDARAWPREGPAPRAGLLARVKTARAGLARADSRMTHIIGVDQPTVVGVRGGPRGFEYCYSRNGDGTVPVARARMKHLRNHFVDELHANLPANPRVIGAVIDLLRQGHTRALARHWSPRRGTTAVCDDASLRLAEPPKIDWDVLDSGQREAMLGILDQASPPLPRG